MPSLTTWFAPALDALVIVLLAAVLWHLRRDPTAAWTVRERRLGEIFDQLRVLVAQSEGVARELDGALAARQDALQELVADMIAARTTAAPAPGARDAAARSADSAAAAAADSDDLVRRIQQLAATALPIEEIARRVEMPAAEVRVLVGLHGRGQSARRGGGGRNEPAISTLSAD
jgi:hypothetical protein